MPTVNVVNTTASKFNTHDNLPNLEDYFTKTMNLSGLK
jgi:hypothetical protein